MNSNLHHFAAKAGCSNQSNETCLISGLPYIGDGLGLFDGPITEEHIFYITLWTIVVPIVFSLITIIGISGNVLVIFVIVTTKKLHTSTNKFLVNLALSDIIFLGCCVPFQAYKYAAWSWPFGIIWCKIIQYLLYVTAYVTIWTLVCIAAIRYVILVKRNSRLQVLLHGMCIEICMCLWIVMFFIHVPTFNAHQVNSVDVYKYCGINPESTEPVILSFFICAYIVPLSIISVCYLFVIYHLNQNETNAHQGVRRSFRRRNHCIRVSRIIMGVVLCFTIAWLPLHIHMLMSIYWGVPEGKYYEVFRIIWHCMAYGNSLVNPFIYNYVSSDFRDAFKLVCVKIGRRRRRKKHGGSEDPDEEINKLTNDQGVTINGGPMIPRRPSN